MAQNVITIDLPGGTGISILTEEGVARSCLVEVGTGGTVPAGAVLYVPTLPGDWPIPPGDVQAALDELAALRPADFVPYTPSNPGLWPIVPSTAAGALDDLAGLRNAQFLPYTPTVPANWSPVPAFVRNALDQLASKVAPIVGANGAIFVPYTPAVPGNWAPAPTTSAGALDQLAARPVGGGPVKTTLSVTGGTLIPANTSITTTISGVAGVTAASLVVVIPRITLGTAIVFCPARAVGVGQVLVEIVNASLFSFTTPTFTCDVMIF